MFSRTCFVYPWATQGGVERVFLNRLIAFQQAAPALHVDVLFLHDSGGAEPLRAALKELGIGARILVAPDFEADAAYDFVFCVDCPQAFALCERRGFRYAAECHTSYLDNRKYLLQLPQACQRIIVPSALFGQRLADELNGKVTQEIRVLRNFIPWDLARGVRNFRRPGWSRKPLFFFGRMDAHKNPLMVLDALAALEEQGDRRFFALMCGSASPEVDLAAEVARRKLESLVVVLPSVPFAATDELLGIVKDCGGIYISASKGESFGLAAAESISKGMPVLLSEIAEHRFLVGGRDAYLFAMDDLSQLLQRIRAVSSDYETSCADMLAAREVFSAAAFVQDWQALEQELSHE